MPKAKRTLQALWRGKRDARTGWSTIKNGVKQ